MRAYITFFLCVVVIGLLTHGVKEAKQIKVATSSNSVIDAAIARNIPSEHIALLTPVVYAIRRAENGRAGREFGILHPRAIDTNLDTQAGWCAATVYKEWCRQGKPTNMGTFIPLLGKRYCPVGADNDPSGLNKNWVKNATKFYNQEINK